MTKMVFFCLNKIAHFFIIATLESISTMDISAVRNCARECGWEEVLYGAPVGVCIFQSGETYISVWYNTGTVAVQSPHPRRESYAIFHFGQTVSDLYQLFHSPRDITDAPQPSLDSEEKAIKRQLTAIDLEVSQLEQDRADLQARLASLPTSRATSINDDGLEALERRKKELAEEIRILEKKKSMGGRVVGGPSDFGPSDSTTMVDRMDTKGAEQPHPFASQKSVYLNRSASSVLRETPGRLKGNRCLYSFLNESYQEEFARAWAERPVNCVALSRGYVVVYDDGGVAWWNIPFALEGKFRDEDLKLPPLKFVALGPEDNYFVKFVNGKMEWIAKDSFQTRIRRGVEEEGLYVNHVALGAGGSWVILWSNGLVDFDGVASDLELVLNQANEEGPGVREVSLGPGGEWFVIFTDNSVQANNLPNSLHAALRQIKAQGGRVRTMMFGDSGSWYLRYWDGKA